MESLYAMIGQQMKWEQPSFFKMEYELHANDLVVATLRFRSSWGTFATAESADGCWTFKRVGFWQTRATIRPCSSEAEIASFKNNTWSSGGTLELPDGRQYRANTNFWQSKYSFTDPAGQPMVQYSHVGGFKLSGLVDIDPSARQVPELPWMVMLGWYLVIMMHQDSAAATAAVTAAVS